MVIFHSYVSSPEGIHHFHRSHWSTLPWPRRPWPLHWPMKTEVFSIRKRQVVEMCCLFFPGTIWGGFLMFPFRMMISDDFFGKGFEATNHCWLGLQCLYTVRSTQRFNPTWGYHQEVVLQEASCLSAFAGARSLFSAVHLSGAPQLPSLKQANDEIRRNFVRKVCLGERCCWGWFGALKKGWPWAGELVMNQICTYLFHNW